MKKKILTILLLFAAFSVIGLFTGCKKAAQIVLGSPENIAYDGQYLTWDKVELANYYTVKINDGNATRANSTTFSYTTTEKFDATITAVFDGVENSTSATFSPLATIEEIFVADNGELSWDSVSGATAYLLSINGKTTECAANNYADLPEGNSRVKIRPIVSGDNSFFSAWSKEKTLYIYSAPAGVKYDGSEITWGGNSLEYEITVGGKTEIAQGNSYRYDSKNRDFSVSIKTVGNHTTTFDSSATETEFKYLSPVTQIFVTDGKLKWNAVENAEKYKIKINGVIARDAVTDAEYSGLSTGISVSYSIMPVNESGNYFSSWSAEKIVYLLDVPVTDWKSELELDGEANNNFVWNAVNAAKGYSVKLTFNGGNEQIFNFSDAQRAFAYAYSDIGEYEVQVKAVDDDKTADYYDSQYSAPLTIKRLAAPKALNENFVTSDGANLAAGFTVNFERVGGASGYQLYKDGVLLAGKRSENTSISDTDVAQASVSAQQHYTYSVKSLGKTDLSARYIVLPCLSSQALTFDITVQAAPQNLRMSGYNLFWDAVAGNNGYVISYGGNSVVANAENSDLSTLKAGTYSVAVNSRGNGAQILASNYSAPITIKRIESPRDIKITAQANGTLGWQAVADAKSYQVFLGLSETALDENSYDNMYQFINTDGTTLTMLAVANYYNDDKTIYYMSSESSPTQQFIRLAAPVFPEGAVANSVELLWNTPSNVNMNEYSPTYRLFSSPDEQIGGGDLNAAKYSIEYLEGGGTYNFYVRAIGNDVKYLDSELSVQKTVYKLITPKFTIQDGKYVWQSVPNASAYYMTIDGEKVSDEFHVSGSEYSFTPRYDEATVHKVVLFAVGDARNNLNSAEFKYEQKTKVLKSPQIAFAYSAETFVKNGVLTVTITTPSENCTKYRYEVAGESVDSDKLYYSKTIQNTGKYSVRVMALGGTFDENEVYFVNSEYTGGNAAFVLTLLGAPSYSTISINSDGVIKWGAVAGCYGYDYQISFDGGEWSDITHTGYANLAPITDFKKYRTISVRVRATGGNGGKTITSEFVEWSWTNSSL